jgi:hypothetical protein
MSLSHLQLRHFLQSKIFDQLLFQFEFLYLSARGQREGGNVPEVFRDFLPTDVRAAVVADLRFVRLLNSGATL